MIDIQSKNGNSKFFLLTLLGMLTAFGPFVTDMYLPSLPSMREYFKTTPSLVQLGLTASMIGLAAGEIFFGSLSDKYGRRSPMLAAMYLFIISTIGCIFAPTIEIFVILRLLQGIAGAGGIVISRSVATDMFTGKELAKTLAIIGAINGVAPVAAPIIGGGLTEGIGWKGIFWVLLALGIILLLGCRLFRESLPEEQRKATKWHSMFASFAQILRNRRYMAYVLQFGFAQGVLFAYIASSPFIVQEHYGFSAFGFSICFAANAVAIGLAAGLSVRFRQPENSTLASSIGMLALSIIVCIAMILNCNFWIYEGLLITLLFMMGFSFTSTIALAMECEREHAGAASALLGAVGFGFGGLVSPLVGLGDTMVTTGIVFMACATCSLGCILWARKINALREVSPIMRKRATSAPA